MRCGVCGNVIIGKGSFEALVTVYGRIYAYEVCCERCTELAVAARDAIEARVRVGYYHDEWFLVLEEV